MSFSDPLLSKDIPRVKALIITLNPAKEIS